MSTSQVKTLHGGGGFLQLQLINKLFNRGNFFDVIRVIPDVTSIRSERVLLSVCSCKMELKYYSCEIFL